MSLEYAMLGFLQTTPLSGYDMKKMFDNSIRHFWQADQSQIYRTLARLTKEELIESETIINDNRPNSKIYYITKKGKEEFNQWLVTPAKPVEPRISWLIQVFFAGDLPDDKIIYFLEQVYVQIRANMEKYEACFEKEKQNTNHKLTKREMFFRDLTFDYGMSINQASISWIENVIERIKRKDYIS